MSVSKTILEQLGGQKFIVMTGAKAFVGGSDYLMFALPGNPGYVKDGWNKVKITLTPDDLYEVTFMRIRGLKVMKEETVKGVYNDMLRSIFTKYTGLYTSLRG